jgi:hypothetical protein
MIKPILYRHPIAIPTLAYFAIVFGAGFLLGTMRVLWFVPKLGVRFAELTEMPIMLVVIFFAARWVTKHFSVPPVVTSRFIVGALALICLLIMECLLVLLLQGIPISEYLENRDPVSSAFYIASLILFALMPLLVNRTR